MTVNVKGIKQGEPWAPILATLRKLEASITAGESNAMEARWLFGKELLSRRKDYKGRSVIPADLMKLAIEQCKRNKVEINWRVRFALRFETKKEMLHACNDYPSWRQMITVGLVEKKAPKKPRAKKSETVHSGPWVIRRLSKEVARAFTQHTTLTREQVKDLEDLEQQIRAILAQVDRNDDTRTEAAAS